MHAWCSLVSVSILACGAHVHCTVLRTHMYIVQYCVPTCLHLFANDLQLAQVHPFHYIVMNKFQYAFN